MNDEEIVGDDHYQISVKEDEHLYRLDVVDVTENHCGKVKVVAKNENGEDSKEVSNCKKYIFFHIKGTNLSSFLAFSKPLLSIKH